MSVRRYWRYIIKSIFWILLVIVGLTLLYRLENDGSKKESASKDSTYLSRGISFTRGNIHMDVAAGYQGKVRLGRYVQLKADIRNTGGDFRECYRYYRENPVRRKHMRGHLRFREEKAGRSGCIFLWERKVTFWM